MSIENKYKKCKSENATFHVNLKNVKKCKSWKLTFMNKSQPKKM